MNTSWQHFQDHYLRYQNLGFSIDLSLSGLEQSYIESLSPQIDKAFDDMKKLEAGEIANPDEGRMVGHYWLRDPQLAPDQAIQQHISDNIAEIKDFAQAIHSGSIQTPSGETFQHVLLIGIGGSALGPQLLAGALAAADAPLAIHFFDNTDPDGIDHTLACIGDELDRTLVLVISKSGGTAETRNGMLEAARVFEKQKLPFAQHAVAITGEDSQLDQKARTENWLKRFHMADWTGGRTSIMSVVGLVPAALIGIDIDAMLAGAAAMDQLTRNPETRQNAAMLQALAWHQAGNGKGEKDLVILPYKDGLGLFGKYLQQLIMESLGKAEDLDGKVVYQGIAVYGNKGSTDQHAYVQQLRDGVNNFIATLIEVQQTRSDGQAPLEVEPGATTGDFLEGFLRGTREALSANGRPVITLSIKQLNAHSLGSLIALFERSTGFYASLVNINAYHQPGVEAGKKAAGEFLKVLKNVLTFLRDHNGETYTATRLAEQIDGDTQIETLYHALQHLATNDPSVASETGNTPNDDQFTYT
ncbi:MAG: glucose-6-phosphate isomerase [Verrucomicrobiales bacterium]|nr:glucose-6-phosphate isomerase [Verrucomicrobiales bacterium]